MTEDQRRFEAFIHECEIEARAVLAASFEVPRTGPLTAEDSAKVKEYAWEIARKHMELEGIHPLMPEKTFSATYNGVRIFRCLGFGRSDENQYPPFPKTGEYEMEFMDQDIGFGHFQEDGDLVQPRWIVVITYTLAATALGLLALALVS